MHLYQKIFITTLFTFNLNIFSNNHLKNTAQKLLYIETGNNDEYTCNNVLIMADALGFTPSFKQIYQVNTDGLKDYAAIIINIEEKLFTYLLENNTLQNEFLHPYAQILDTILYESAQQKNKKIIISLPHNLKESSQDIARIIVGLVTKIGVKITPEIHESLINYSTTFNVQDSERRYRYATSLLNITADEITEEYYTAQSAFKDASTPKQCFALPSILPTRSHTVLEPLWPLGLMCNNTPHNEILITRDSYLHFADIRENYYLTPLDPITRYDLLTTTYHMLQQFLLGTTKSFKSLPCTLAPNAKDDAQTKIKHKRAARMYSASHRWIKDDSIRCAWMDVKSYTTPESVDHLLDSGINLLWLDLIPEIFLSHDARAVANKELFLTQVERFTRFLKERAHILNKPLPHLFMGTDITLNYRTVPVTIPTVTLYGKTLAKIPSPLDIDGFWQTQVVEVFNTFVDLWESKLSNGLPLDGIFFDFEMFQAPDQAIGFIDTIDFTDFGWELFLSEHPQEITLNVETVNQRVQYLIDTHQMEAYYATLRNRAQEVGRLIRAAVKARLPHGIIAAYNKGMPSSWWYMGLMSTLSTPEEPIVFGTYNNNFFSHASWLEDQGVYMHHMQAIMLSKLRKSQDFDLIDSTLKNHDGYWLSRLSRLVEKEPNDELESSPLTPDQMAQGLSKHLHARKQ